MESVEQHLDRCLAALRTASERQAPGELLWPELQTLLASEAIAASLVARVAALDATTADAGAAEEELLEYLLDEARRAREADRAGGADFLAAAESALVGLDAVDVREGGAVALGRAWYRAGLDTPQAVHALQVAFLNADSAPEREDADLEEAGLEPEVLADPERARLQPLFDRARDAPDGFGGYFGLHGYLFAIATHPELVVPGQWLNPLLQLVSDDGSGLTSEAELQAVLTDLQNLYNRVNDHAIHMRPALPEGCLVSVDPAAMTGPDAPLGQWSMGFSRARERFGHLADHDFAAASEMPELEGMMATATHMIEFLATGKGTNTKSLPGEPTFDELAHMACDSFGPNLYMLCLGRRLVQAEQDDDIGPALAAARFPEENGAEPLSPTAILERLDDPDASYQWAVMDQAVAQQHVLIPLLLDRVEAVLADPEAWVDHGESGLLYTLALLGHFGATEAHEPLLRLSALPAVLQEPLLGDATTELLPVVLWRTAGGEAAGLKGLVEDRNAQGFGRGAGIGALVYGVLFGVLDRRQVVDYLIARLHDPSFAPRDDPAWSCVVHGLLDLYPQEYEAEIRHCMRHDNPDPFGVREDDLDHVLAQGRDAYLAKQREWAERRFPADVHGYLSRWSGFQPADPADSHHGVEPLADPFLDDFDPGAPPPAMPGKVGVTKARGPTPGKKKDKRKQQKKARKKNRKRG